MSGFAFDAYVVRIIDGDTAVMDAQVDPPDIYKRIRFKDRFAAEIDDPDPTRAQIAAAEKAEAEKMFPPGKRVTLTNTRINFTYVTRLEARVDLA